MEKLKFKEIPQGQEVIGTSITITESHVVLFAGLSGDFYPLHMNQEVAKTTPFGGRIAHGMLTFAIGSGMLAREFNQWDVQTALGFEATRFTAPVKLGDTITPIGTVIDKEQKGNDRGIINVKIEIKTQEGAVVVDSGMKVMVNN